MKDGRATVINEPMLDWAVRMSVNAALLPNLTKTRRTAVLEHWLCLGSVPSSRVHKDILMTYRRLIDR